MDNTFYEKQSIITNPGIYEARYGKLPDNEAGILKLVRGLVINADMGKLYGVTFSKRQTDEEMLRTVPQILERLFNIAPVSLDTAREPSLRLVGMCRDYSLLYVSFLRYRGIASRVRVGYANYFEPKLVYEDQWITEYYSQEEARWIKVDTQIDEIQKKYYNIRFKENDIAHNEGFILAGEAWKLCREGNMHPEDFGYNNGWKGYISIKANLLNDFNCLIGLELMPWDLWTELSTKKYNELTKKELQILDRIAEVTARENVSENDIRELFKYLPESYMNEITSQLKIYGVSDKERMIDPEDICKREKERIISKHHKAECSSTHQTYDSTDSITDGKEPTIKTKSKYDINKITLIGGRQNNLRAVNVAIPKNKLTVITGVSGSGKSSLAFDTIYAEGKRRYLENMSGMARMQEQVERPEFEALEGLTPTIAIEQKKGSQNPRSTVGTLSGIANQLRMLYVAIGRTYCPYCGELLQPSKKNKCECPKCGNLYQKLTAALFNPNNHVGACHSCNGLGLIYEPDEHKIISNEDISVLDGASAYFGKLKGRKPTGNWMVGELYAIAADRGVDISKPWKELPESFKRAVLYGTGENKIYHYQYTSNGRQSEINRPALGAIYHINRLFREAKTEDNMCMQFMKERPCPVCNGEMLCTEARYTTVLGYRLPELMNISINDLFSWCKQIQENLSQDDHARADEIIEDMKLKINNLLEVGLPYLTLARTAPTLSGGELQRVRLSGQLGSDLVGITYILDEPSIGLHPRDHYKMINTMKSLRDKGNTVIVVEHDRDTMLNADYIIDVGPGAGVLGGTIIAEGSLSDIMNNEASITAHYLKNKPMELTSSKLTFDKSINMLGCNKNNLKAIDVKIPLGKMVCITGPSGSGKSTLVFDTLIPEIQKAISHKGILADSTGCQKIEGVEYIDGLVEMDQSPIGKNSRSTPATYIGVFDNIRKLFASLPESVRREYKDSHFSFNSGEGCCPICEGNGQVLVKYQYMPDHYVRCPECGGKRFKDEILEIKYCEKSISEVLNMDILTAADFFKDQVDISGKLELMNEVGLTYLKLGQSTATLSGGESQRIKLASELGNKKRSHMLYVLDEPTTGLHFKDIDKLLLIFKKLAKAGHSLLIIEHNTEVIRESDWVIDMGPEGGNNGGYIVAEGTPYDIKNNPDSITGKYL